MGRRAAYAFILIALNLGSGLGDFVSPASASALIGRGSGGNRATQATVTSETLAITRANRALLTKPNLYLRLTPQIIREKRHQVLQTLLFQNFPHLNGLRYNQKWHPHIEMFLENAIWIWEQPGPDDRIKGIEDALNKIRLDAEPSPVALPACEYFLTKSVALGDSPAQVREESDRWAAMTLALQLIALPTKN